MQLAEFLVLVATEPDRLTAFIADPDAAMRQAGLTAADRDALQGGDAAEICRRLVTVDPAADGRAGVRRDG